MHSYLLFGLLWLAGCTSVAQPIPSQALAPGDAPLAVTLRQQAEAHPPGQSGFRLLADSGEAFSARAELIGAARHSLDLQYYILHEGLSTRVLIDELLRAADRGVRVRLLLDDTASDGRDYEIALLAAHPQIQIRVFNALHTGRGNTVTRTLGRLLNLGRQHRRMHNKLWLADSSVAIVGGRNLGDEYFNAKPRLNFADLDLLAAGPLAASLAQSFDQYWNHQLSVPIQQFLSRPPSARALAKTRRQLADSLAAAQRREPHRAAPLLAYRYTAQLPGWLESLTWAHGQALWDAPNKLLASGEPDPRWLLTTQLAPHLELLREELLLVSAYFIPVEKSLPDLTRRADAGIAVYLLTNSLEATDVPAVHGAYAPYRTSLLKHGVKLFELRRQPDEESSYSFSGSSESSLHSKALVIDRRKVFIGSFNFDPRSVLWNTEVGVLVDSAELAGEVRRLILQGMQPSISYEVQLQERAGRQHLVWIAEDAGRVRRLEREPGSLWRRLNAWLAEWIGLERLL